MKLVVMSIELCYDWLVAIVRTIVFFPHVYYHYIVNFIKCSIQRAFSMIRKERLPICHHKKVSLHTVFVFLSLVLG